jgi:hypothetical protein
MEHDLPETGAPEMTASQGNCRLSEGFTLWEKLHAQLTFWTMLATAYVGIARSDWPWLVPYLVLTAYGVLGIVMRHLTCPRCPHLFVYGDCLQFPPTWSKWLVKERKTTPFSAAERWTFYLIFLLIPLYPLYWLQPQSYLLAVFAASASLWYLGQWLFLCKRCRVSACPFNRVPQHGKEPSPSAL